MKRFFAIVFFIFASGYLFAQPDSLQKIIGGRENSKEQQEKPYVILISADGFRYDYAEKFHANNLLALANDGVRAEAMIPSYPSLTFPNHYTLVTGLYPSHHGIVNNYFFDSSRRAFYGMRDRATVRDGSWYGGTPIWVLAEHQQMLSSSFFWVGSEADIQGTRPSYYYQYNDSIPMSHRVQVVVDWLKLPPEKRPHLITFYISQADHAGHTYGPDAPETNEAVRFIDSSIQELTEAVKTTALPVNFIFVSDHGMTKIDPTRWLPIPAAVDTSKFIIPRGAELLELYARNKSDIAGTYQKLKREENGFKVYLKTNMPPHLHYDQDNDRLHRIGDILLLPDWPGTFKLSDKNPDIGAHGYDPSLVPDMRASFYAWGPAFKKGLRIPAFENVNVYPLVAAILGLHITDPIDGTMDLANKILK